MKKMPKGASEDICRGRPKKKTEGRTLREALPSGKEGGTQEVFLPSVGKEGRKGD